MQNLNDNQQRKTGPEIAYALGAQSGHGFMGPGSLTTTSFIPARDWYAYSRSPCEDKP